MLSSYVTVEVTYPDGSTSRHVSSWSMSDLLFIHATFEWEYFND
jgi:hypothetical protein